MTRAQTRRIRATWAAAATLLIGACDVDDPYSGPVNELPEQSGVLLAGSDGIQIGAPMLWSADGSELFFETPDGAVRAVAPAATAARQVDAARDRSDLNATAAAVYFVADRQGSHASAYRVVGTQMVRLSDRVPNTTTLGQADGRLVLGRGDDGIAAYIVAPDSLYTYETATGSHAFIVTGCVRVVAFSPNGNELLCRREGSRDNGYARVDLGARTATVMTLLPVAGTLRLPHWDPVAIRALYTVQDRFRVRNVEDGTATQLWAPLPTTVRPVAIDFLHYAWSADGSRFAFWVHECLQLDRAGNCDRGQSLLYTIHMATNTAKLTAVVKGTRGGEQLALTPDGNAVAYAFNGRIYYQPI